MLKVVLTLAAALCLAAGGSTSAFAAPSPPTRTTSTFFSSFSEDCGPYDACVLNARTTNAGDVVVTFTVLADVPGEDDFFELVAEGSASVESSAVSFTDGGSVSPTFITLLVEGSDEIFGEVTVSAEDTPTGERATKDFFRDMQKVPGCLSSSSFRTTATPVKGFIEIEGVGQYPEIGATGTTTETSNSNGKDCQPAPEL